MTVQRGYLIYGFLVIALVALAEYRGWSMLNVAEANEEPVPVSMRDNPGAYRAQYTTNTRYIGGK